MQNTDSTQDFIENSQLTKLKRTRNKKKITRFLIQTFNLVEVKSIARVVKRSSALERCGRFIYRRRHG